MRARQRIFLLSAAAVFLALAVAVVMFDLHEQSIKPDPLPLSMLVLNPLAALCATMLIMAFTGLWLKEKSIVLTAGITAVLYFISDMSLMSNLFHFSVSAYFFVFVIVEWIAAFAISMLMRYAFIKLA